MKSIKSRGVRVLIAVGVGAIAVLAPHNSVTRAQLPPVPAKVTPEKPDNIRSGGDSWNQAHVVRSFKGQLSTPNSLIFSPDGRYVISGGSLTDPILRVWLVDNENPVAAIRAQRTTVQTLLISPDGRTLVSSGDDGAINGWDWTTGEYLGLSLTHGSKVLALASTPDGGVLISGGLDGIRIWDMKVRRPIYRLAWIGNAVYALAVKSDGVTLAAGENDGKVKYWNIRQGKLLSEFSPHKEAVTALLYTRDGQKLITGSVDRTIKIWDAGTNRLLYTLKGHSARIRSMVLHPDGQTLASASDDGIRLWNISTGKLINHLGSLGDWVESLDFSPNGQYLVSGGYNSSVLLWQYGPGPAPGSSPTPVSSQP
ncbi:MAG: WD40 repeat domain-containing protein [Chlorogloea purpurea SAG 13.99]|nr:WD40 repeat domain-containing protein [Chlorogloea purpurea SAG 13.99]